MSIQARLDELGITLHAPPAPVGAYVPAVRAGEMVYTSGQLPVGPNGELIARGKVPTVVSEETAKAAASRAAINALAAVASVVSSLDEIERVVRVTVYVNSAAGFSDQAQIANGASEILHAILGPAGQHTRCAVGAAELPLHSPVEVDLVVKLKPTPAH